LELTTAQKRVKGAQLIEKKRVAKVFYRFFFIEELQLALRFFWLGKVALIVGKYTKNQ